MKKLAIVSLIASFVLLLAPQQADAQVSVEVGPRLGLDVGDIEELFIGADGRIASADLPVVINPAFDYYFVEDVTIFGTEFNQSVVTFDINALYEFGVDNQAFTPYAGGGLGSIRSSIEANGESESETEIGLNIVGGAQFETGNLRPFVQAKINVGSDVTLFGVMGGLLFGF